MGHLSGRSIATPDAWPALPLEAWRPTLDTLHLWLQVVGKVNLELVPFVNQWWNVALLPTARGLTTGVIPYGERAFELDLDFLGHTLAVRTSDGGRRDLALAPRAVAAFEAELLAALAALAGWGVEHRADVFAAREQFDRLQAWRSNREGMQARSRAGAQSMI